ncbi:MAG TPA: MarR family transcriptional regulator [Kofleriaceae bacterium]|nr:MarR family transcriptional regulator [Kofleriaceae bacterium]
MRSESAGSALTSPQVSVLHRLQETGPATAADLARAELITPQAMAVVIAALEADGYIARKSDSNDARCRLISITKSGQRAFEEGRAARQSWLTKAVESEIAREEMPTLRAGLALLRRLAER